MTEELKSLKDWGCICQTIKVFFFTNFESSRMGNHYHKLIRHLDLALKVIKMHYISEYEPL